ncbi:MAG: hypothetical protein JO351_07485 [Candidatus Eremiobacteraeota bacterium]|nr:hypothetical protein [Candidatus Eremiobacteraeota bacterium]
MKHLRFAVCAVGMGAALGVLAACAGGSQSSGAVSSSFAPLGVHGGLPFAGRAPSPNFIPGTPVRHRSHGKSWMAPREKPDNLLYIANSYAATVDVYSWRLLKQVGSLTGFSTPYTMCVDKAQDVYVADFGNGNIVEYAHGGTSPIKTLTQTYGPAIGCSVDPTSGNLAVSIFNGSGTVLIYPNGSGTPTAYTANLTSVWPPSYDSSGNLFVEGYDNVSGAPALNELPAGSSTFSKITLPFSIVFPGCVAWDGKYVAVGDQGVNTIYQITVSGSTASLQGTTVLGGATDVFQFFVPKFGNGQVNPQGNRVVGADFGASAADKWLYPVGGVPTKTITGFTNPEGAVVSK